jgi:hypothetical protein
MSNPINEFDKNDLLNEQQNLSKGGRAWLIIISILYVIFLGANIYHVSQRMIWKNTLDEIYSELVTLPSFQELEFKGKSYDLKGDSLCWESFGMGACTGLEEIANSVTGTIIQSGIIVLLVSIGIWLSWKYKAKGFSKVISILTFIALIVSIPSIICFSSIISADVI